MENSQSPRYFPGMDEGGGGGGMVTNDNALHEHNYTNNNNMIFYTEYVQHIGFPFTILFYNSSHVMRKCINNGADQHRHTFWSLLCLWLVIYRLDFLNFS